MNVRLSGVRIAPFLRRLLVAFPLAAVLLVLLSGSRIDAPSFHEFASLRLELVAQHFHGVPRVRLAEQATWYARGHRCAGQAAWYARGHRRAGQHCEVNFATHRSCQHLEDFLCFDKFQQPTRVGTLSLFSIFFSPFQPSAFEADGYREISEPNLTTCRFSSFTCVRCSSTNRSSDVSIDFLRLFSQDFSKIRRCLFPPRNPREPSFSWSSPCDGPTRSSWIFKARKPVSSPPFAEATRSGTLPPTSRIQI